MDITVIVDNMSLFLRGLKTTVELTAIGMTGGLAFGILLAVGRASSVRSVSSVAFLVIEVIRGVPVILIIFWVYFSGPMLMQQGVSAYLSCAIAMIVFNTSYSAEIVRAGIRSVAAGNREAGRAHGMNTYQIYRYIVLPQALFNMIPALMTQLVMLYKTTSVVYVVGVMDIFRASTIVNNREVRPIEIFIFVSLVYFVPCTILSRVAHYFEGRRMLLIGRS